MLEQREIRIPPTGFCGWHKMSAVNTVLHSSGHLHSKQKVFVPGNGKQPTDLSGLLAQVPRSGRALPGMPLARQPMGQHCPHYVRSLVPPCLALVLRVTTNQSNLP